jgi:Ca2+-binding RTX toxin-like protein
MNSLKKLSVIAAATVSLVGIGLANTTATFASADSPQVRKSLSCKGKRATIVGTGGTVRGTSHRDVIVLTGASTVFAGGGNDLICGSKASDEIHGGRGKDRIFGRGGDDDLFGDQGDDSVNGGAGDDSIDGGSGRDRSSGGSGADDIDGIDDHGNHVEPGDDHGVHAPGTDDHGQHGANHS